MYTVEAFLLWIQFHLRDVATDLGVRDGKFGVGVYSGLHYRTTDTLEFGIEPHPKRGLDGEPKLQLTLHYVTYGSETVTKP